MTIIEPNKNQSRFQPLLITLIAAMVLGILSGVYLYNQNVNLSYQLAEQEEYWRELEAESAVYRNEFYRILEDRHLSTVVEELGLIKEGQPEYLKSQVAILAAH